MGGVASGTGSRKSARLRRKAAKKGTAEQKMDHPPMSMGEPSASIGETTSVEQVSLTMVAFEFIDPVGTTLCTFV